jgi:glutamine amidotransferase
MIALIDYGAGNLTSVRKALAHLGAAVSTPATPDDLEHAEAIIVPGVGNFAATGALDDTWRDAILAGVGNGRPMLGICLGMQWLFEESEEAPTVRGLGLMGGACGFLGRTQEDGGAASPDPERVPAGPRPPIPGPRSPVLKVPHVGWNSLHLRRASWLLDGIGDGDQVYFTHSFAPPVTADCVASTTYGADFASVVERRHVAGVQFHPEKSGDVGLRILSNFLKRTRAI